MIQWHLEVRSIKDLKEHPKNPRQLTKEQERNLRKSLDKFGLADKPIINTDGTIIGGHQRLRILKKELNEIECWVPNRTLDEKEVDELCVRLNANHGEWDFDTLGNEFDLSDLMEWGIPEKMILDDFDLSDDIQGSKEKKSKTNKCPSCGHEF